MSSRQSLTHTAWFASVAIALGFLVFALLCAPAHSRPLGLLAGATFGDGHTSQLLGLTYDVSPRFGLFVLGDLRPDHEAANARGLVHLPLSDNLRAHLLLGPEVQFDDTDNDSLAIITHLSLSTGLAISYRALPRLSLWAALDYKTPSADSKAARFGLGITAWLSDP